MEGYVGSTSKNNESLVREYVAWLRDVKGHRPATIYNYAATLDPFLDSLKGQPLRADSLEHLERFLVRLRMRSAVCAQRLEPRDARPALCAACTSISSREITSTAILRGCSSRRGVSLA